MGITAGNSSQADHMGSKHSATQRSAAEVNRAAQKQAGKQILAREAVEVVVVGGVAVFVVVGEVASRARA